MPKGAVYVGRPTKYGNPFKIIGDKIFSDISHRRKILSPWIIYNHSKIYTIEEGKKKCVELYELWVKGILSTDDVKPCPFTLEEAKEELQGKTLGCFCSVDDPCHADVLLKLLN